MKEATFKENIDMVAAEYKMGIILKKDIPLNN